MEVITPPNLGIKWCTCMALLALIVPALSSRHRQTSPSVKVLKELAPNCVSTRVPAKEVINLAL
jgi:hypothetical protein